MKLHLQRPGAAHQITAYMHDAIRVNDVLCHNSVIVAADLLIHPWRPTDLADLQLADLEPVRDYGAEILLLGTGPRQQFPETLLFKALRHAFPSIEIMDTPAACRTYNILMGEDRRVVTALLTR